MNHDFADGLKVLRHLTALLCSESPGRWQIMVNKLSCFLMKDGPCRETSTHEVNEGLRGSRVKFEEATEDILI